MDARDTPPRLRRYDGAEATVTYDAARCIHAAVCVRGLPAVFDPERRPWIAPDAAPAPDVLAVVAACPTGALHARLADGTDLETPPPRATATAASAGPLYVHGDVTVRAADGTVLLRDTRVAFCRCGRSRHKPFCDNAHLAADGRPAFDHDGALPPRESRPADEVVETDGPLAVTLRPDGPLFCQGPLTIAGADGQTVQRMKVSLCRCGLSGRMPFCDGAHRTAGFSAP